MELESCFICGKPVLNDNALYCSNECKNSDGNNSINSSLPYQSQNNSLTPPMNLHFSITIPPSIFKASNSNAKVSSPSSMSSSYSDSNLSSSFASLRTIDQNYNDNYNNYHYNHCCDNYDDDSVDIDNSDYYTSYYSTSNPIDIPSPRTQAANDPALEPNKGTFGREKSILETVVF